MRCLTSHLNRWMFMVATMFFFIVSAGWADNIEIDLGNSTAGTKPTSTSTPVSSGPSSQGSIAASPVQSSNQTSKAADNTSGSAIVKIAVSNEVGITKVLINGNNLPKPMIDKLSDKKIRLKFSKTNLNIKTNLPGDGVVVKDIRSALHPGKIAWVVLDVNGVSKYDLVKTDSGYSLVLNPTAVAESPSANVANTETTEPAATSPLEENEKGLFARLVDVSFKPIDNGIKVVLTSDGPLNTPSEN